MTTPVWMALPPEVHSALISSGPGPGSMLAAAGAWNTLSVEYASVAEELSALLAGVQAGAWEGPTAESYAAAHVPFLAWLMQTSADSVAAAAQLETVAAAYAAALAAMPTLAELAANHAIHAVLVATNFFGINTIPIALNEADYVRMWVQAAMTMATYQAVSTIALASTPHTSPAPQIQKSAGSTSASTGTQPAESGFSTGLGDLLDSLADRLGLGPLVDEFGIDHIFQFLNNPVQFTEQLITKFLANPVAALANPASLIFDGDEVIAPFFLNLPPFYYLYPLAIAPVGAVGGVVGLAEPTSLPQPAAEPALTAPASTPAAAAPEPMPVAATAPASTALVAGSGTAPAPTTAPATGTVAGSAPPPVPVATGVASFTPPYAVGPPGIGSDSGMGSTSSASAKRKAPQPDTTAAVSAVAAREQARVRRRRRAKLRGHGDEFMEMNVEVDPDWGAPPGEAPVASIAASDQRAGPLGFAGTVRKGAVSETAGLTMLAGDEFGGGPTIPMVPGTWGGEHDRPNKAGAADDDL
ncbi:PPE family protein [Mycobacterium xenopi RIVM700367]|uniref:PPE family protein n=1 Tax=Mycobacterium xenopi TaxID=1789 RepID=UPI00025AD3CE|nr:PPE family protein [Mycobacterium xenopi]EID15063.1 PPE family protein [Mycobacterium xenopi RIVM700367]